jgi:NAD dependent epimerase/dehydratase
MKKTNVFITGSEGFIGSHLTEKLVDKGHNVIALVKYNFDGNIGWLDKLKSENKKNLKIVFGDITDYNLISSLTKNIDIIFNLAALISIPYSFEAPYSYMKNNVEGVLNILNVVKTNNIKQLINTSTSEVYGSAQKIPIKESHQLNAQSPYAASKIAADQFVNSFYHSYNLPVTTIRPFNTFGPRQSLRAIIPTIITQALHSNKIKLGNVKTLRDFMYVEDTVDGFIKAMNNKRSYGHFINLGTNKNVSIMTIVKLISKILNKKIVVIADKKRLRPNNSEVVNLVASNILAKKILKWEPNYINTNGLEAGLIKTIKWYKENLNHYSDNYKNFNI